MYLRYRGFVYCIIPSYFLFKGVICTEAACRTERQSTHALPVGATLTQVRKRKE